MIKIKNLIFQFKGGFKLDIPSLQVKKGEIFGLLGKNGAGKTTLLNILALFERPSQGRIRIFKEELSGKTDVLQYRRRCAFVFSKPYLLKGTVYDNVRLPLKLRGAGDISRVIAVLKQFNIEDLKYTDISALSQGQVHRVSLARAFAPDPAIIFMDEPFISLDRKYKDDILLELRKKIKEKGITAMFVSQDHDEALKLCDRIAVMKSGRILESGTPEKIYTHPALKETADFVGIETVASGRIVKKEENLCHVKVKGNIIEAVSKCNLKDKVFVLVQPENVIVSRSRGKNSARNTFKARITDIKQWGLEYKLILNCGFNLNAFVTKQSLTGLNLKTGQNVFVSFKATGVHLIKR